jgi:hypothetical protein
VALRFYFDEDSMSRALIRALAARGIDVANAVDAGLSGLTDAAHLEFAAEAGRVLYSFNVRDFHRLHGEWLDRGKSHAGLVLVPQQVYSIGEQLRRLLKLSSTVSADEMRDRVEFLGSWG